MNCCIVLHPSEKPAFLLKSSSSDMAMPMAGCYDHYAASSPIFHSHLSFLFCRADFSWFNYSSMNAAQPCHGFPLAGGTAWQDSCLQLIIVQRAPPKCPFLSPPLCSLPLPSQLTSPRLPVMGSFKTFQEAVASFRQQSCVLKYELGACVSAG